MCEISMLTIKKPERRYSGVFIVNLEQIPHIVLVFKLLTFKKVNVSWVKVHFMEILCRLCAYFVPFSN